MSHALYRLGRFAARRPWTVIGTWTLVALVVVGASVSFGRDLEDSFEAPGLDSTAALGLLTSTGSDAAGPTAQIVLTPHDGSSFFTSKQAQTALANVRASAVRLPNVLGASDPSAVLLNGPEAATADGSVSPDGRVALIRLQYRVIDELDAEDLDNLKQLVADLDVASPLQVELNGDLFAAFEESQTGIGEMPGAVFAHLVAFDGIVHGWDLATSTGQPWNPPDALVADLDAFARSAISTDMRADAGFGPERQADANARLIDRLVAFAGRPT